MLTLRYARMQRRRIHFCFNKAARASMAALAGFFLY